MISFDHKAVTFTDDVGEEGALSERNKQLRDKVVYGMTEGLAFRDPSLSIVTLASKIEVTQHRLRSLINENLGYKNFCEFVNAYRIEDVKSALSDRKMEHIPILTTALESGFNSLSSFNRAFKNSQGMTPTEFRNQNWGPCQSKYNR